MFSDTITDFVFTPGKLTTVLDAQAGSSGKGKLGSFICEHSRAWQFACNTFSPQAGHWTVLDDGRRFFYQTLNSCAYLTDRYEKLYIGPGAIIEQSALWREIEQNKIPQGKLGISPLTAILQDIDGGYEKGTHDFNGRPLSVGEAIDREVIRDAFFPIVGGYLAATGTTAHGAGACRARRVLRRPEAKYARDIPELKPYLCDVPGEIMTRLDQGQSGLMEVAQGFQLSYLLPEHFPFTTSRNCSVAAGLDDMMLPPCCAGNTILNLRTFPIRINSNKYVDRDTGKHLTWDEINARRQRLDVPIAQQTDEMFADCGVVVVRGNSGSGYPDQQEISWDELTISSGSPSPLMEMTSVTRLPRRVFSFSQQNLQQAIRYNRGNGEVFLSLNFVNYCDTDMTGRRGTVCRSSLGDTDILTVRAKQWLTDNLGQRLDMTRFLGTGARTDDCVVIDG